MSDEQLNMNLLQAAVSTKLCDAISDAEAMLKDIPGRCSVELVKIARVAADCLNQGGKLLFCGNGGSAAECQHLATEFVVRLSAHRERKALAAVAMTTDTSLLTACANDYGFDHVFARQVEALLRAGDVLFMLSTSGRSNNLLLAAEAAGRLGGVRVAFLGQTHSPLDAHSDYVLHVPSASGQRVQEAHLLFGHLLVELIEDLLLTRSDETSRHTS